MRLLFLGDIVGKPGRALVAQALPRLRQRERLDLVVANAENADGGAGLKPESYRQLVAAGVDCVTLGDHVYRYREIYPILDGQPNIVRPANYPAAAPGRGWAVVRSATGLAVAVFCLLGRVFMRPVDCPFQAADRVLAELPAEARVRLVDFHAEATSDKQLLGRYLDGRVSAVLGTHTHVATADECILSGGTAFQCDVGMCGPHDGILGRRYDRVLETTTTFRPTPFDVAAGDARLNGAIVEVDELTGRARSIQRFRWLASNGEHANQSILSQDSADSAKGLDERAG